MLRNVNGNSGLWMVLIVIYFGIILDVYGWMYFIIIIYFLVCVCVFLCVDWSCGGGCFNYFENFK